MPKVLFITTDHNTPYRQATGEIGGVGFYRCYGPANALRKKGWDATVMGKELTDYLDKDVAPIYSYMNLFKGYDLVVIKQADTANVAQLIGACKELKIPIAMDLDDLITELDPDNPALEKGYNGGAKQAFAIAALSMVDALFVSTQPLADEYDKYLRLKLQRHLPTFVLPNCIDPTMWSKQKKHKENYIVVGWHGSVTHDNDLKIVIPAMQDLMKKYPNLIWELTGGVRQETYDTVFAKQFSEDHLRRIVVNKGTQSYNGFPAYMQSHRWDIAIAPLRDTKFARGKSHIKWMENSLLGVPTIASNVYPYREPIAKTPVIQDFETGILVSDDGWFDAIEYLINDKQKRHYLARDANKFVKENWTYDNHVEKWEQALESTIKAGSKRLS